MTLYKLLAVVAIVAAIIAGVGFEVAHLKNEGRDAERASAAAAGQKHEQVMLQNQRDVDQEVARDYDPDGTLRKRWEQTDAPAAK